MTGVCVDKPLRDGCFFRGKDGGRHFAQFGQPIVKPGQRLGFLQCQLAAPPHSIKVVERAKTILQFSVVDLMSRGFASDIIFNSFRGKIAGDGIKVKVDLENLNSLAPDQTCLRGRNPMRNGDLHEKRSARSGEDDVMLVSIDTAARF